MKVIFCIFFFLQATKSNDLDLGIEMVFRAWDSVAWYEAFKVFPFADHNIYNPVPQIIEWYKNDYLKSSSYQVAPNKDLKFGNTFIKQGTNFLPPSYSRKCNKYFLTPKIHPIADESDALNDGRKNYPFKAAAYCLLNHLRSLQGNQAINDVKFERTRWRKNWKQTILDRENKFRGRHGSPPLVLDYRLGVQAQKWADKLASECKMYHTRNEERIDGERVYVGENLGSIFLGNTTDLAISAYIIPNEWYAEVKMYPYIDEIAEPNSPKSQALLHAVGHFTQTVWKATTLVGYGQTCNLKCTDDTGQVHGGCYVVGRYYVAGNRVGKGGFFRQNVQRPRPYNSIKMQ